MDTTFTSDLSGGTFEIVAVTSAIVASQEYGINTTDGVSNFYGRGYYGEGQETALMAGWV